jgi:hypothetical protein
MNRTPFLLKRKINVIQWDRLIFTILFNIGVSLLIVMTVALYSVFTGRSTKEFSEIPSEMEVGVVVMKSSDLQNPSGDWKKLLQDFEKYYNSSSLSQLKTVVIQDSSFVTSGDEFRDLLQGYNLEELGVVDDIYEVCERISVVQKGVIISYNDISSRIAFLCNSETNYYGVAKTDLGIRPRITAVISDIFKKILDVQ